MRTDTDDPGLREVQARVTDLTRPDLRWTKAQPWQFWSVAGMTLTLIMVVIINTATPGMPPWAWAIVGPMIGLGFVALATVRRPVDVNVAVREFLSTGFCASCGYRLGGCPTDADGCVVCPECAAAWRAERIGTQRVEADEPRAAGDWAWVRALFRSPRLATEDARGRRVLLKDPLLRRLSPERQRELGLTRTRTLRYRMWWVRSGIVAYLIFLGAGSMLLYWPGRFPAPGASPAATAVQLGKFLPIAFFSLCMFRAAWLFSMGTSGLKPNKVVAAFVAQRICHCCTHPLERVPVVGDGIITCPQCGSGWRA